MAILLYGKDVEIEFSLCSKDALAILRDAREERLWGHRIGLWV